MSSVSSENISFEHFDPKYELGNLDQNGQPVRPRKKPGRKPNPPSPAQRKAQNRAAQRAFRERKRREMQEAELNVKRSMYQRDQAIQEANLLRQKNEELLYENNYLKGFVLTLKLACMANRVDVPKFWDANKTDVYGSERLTFSRTKGIPQSLEFFLDRHQHIISFPPSSDGNPDKQNDKNLLAKVSSSPPSTIQDLYSSLLDSTSSTPASSSIFNTTSSSTSAPPPSSSHAANDLDVASIAPQLASHLESSFFQQLLGTDLVARGAANDLASLLTESTFSTHTSPDSNNSDDHTDMDLSVYLNDPMDTFFDADNQTKNMVSTTAEEEDNASAYSIGTSCSSNEEEELTVKGEPVASTAAKLPSLGPRDAIARLRALQNAGKDRTLFTPTELQRTIPHDTRIDLIPGAAMRDHMILFQDFYNVDDMLITLIENAVFTGGEIGNPDCWLVPKRFLVKYWFLLPNHRPKKRTDDAVETVVNFGQQMMQMLVERKQMYIDREQYPAHFPRQQQQQQQQQQCDNHQHSQQHEPSSSIPSSLLETMNVFMTANNDIFAAS
ncbi:hypothetical protein BDB00DRAFT_938376 [Zychaea mexicana]|uniref:uncharacterized protein n=1 Tax=Zychaea mexicana TaxID=64656 RepID=UPI0022FE57C9|nr:uncharacterized protein BDB00DRAFT_938376 [Zychaea mexicana]KAI9494383.1 hypothetical protein BDB00DRAFT_938376 [Zychaea mexicana]